MELLIASVLFAIGLAYFFKRDGMAAQARAEADAEAEQRRDEERREAHHRLLHEISQPELEVEISKHYKTLCRKRNQSILSDDYGIVDNRLWVKEVEYFRRSVCSTTVSLGYFLISGTAGDLDDDFDDDFCLNDIGKQAFFVDFNYLLDKVDLQASYNQGQDAAYQYEDFIYSKDMSGIDFERHVAEKIQKLGASIRFTPSTGDQGTDIIAEIDGRTIAIQCKRSLRPVGNAAVQQAAAGARFHGATEAWVVSDAAFTISAKQLASTLDVTLAHFEDLEDQVAGISFGA